MNFQNPSPEAIKALLDREKTIAVVGLSPKPDRLRRLTGHAARVGRIWTPPYKQGKAVGVSVSEEERGVIHGRPAGCAPLRQAGGRAAVDNSARSASQRIEWCLPGLGFGSEIKTWSRGLQERTEVLALRCDCARISGLLAEGGASWP